jgi:hypothetical protein
MTGVWFIQHPQYDNLYWHRRDEHGGWGEADGAAEYTDRERESTELPNNWRWVEGYECDCCHEMRPENGGEGHTGYFSSASIDPPNTWWCCQYCDDYEKGTY